MRRTRTGSLVLFLVVLSARVASAAPYDISPLSDFGASAINNETAILNQDGQNNLAIIDQHVAASWLGGNYAEINQRGAGNLVRTVQNGDGNRLRVAQLGNDNSADITQLGSRNSVDLLQNDSNSQFIAVQTGDDNLIINTQPGGSYGKMTQDGNSNIIKLNQAVAGLNVDIAQHGNEIRVQQN